MSQVDVDSGIENMEVDENDRREKRSLTDKVSLVYVGSSLPDDVCYCNIEPQDFMGEPAIWS